MSARSILLVTLLAACSKSAPNARPQGAQPEPRALPVTRTELSTSPGTPAAAPNVVGAKGELTFTGMCDASAAVALDDNLFAVADDEDNVLRVYDAERGGAPLGAADVSARLSLPVKKHKPKKKPKPLKWPETDIEAATRIGDLAFWITSHGRNSKGKEKPERQRLFATTLPDGSSDLLLSVYGTAYERLLPDLFADARFAEFGLERAAEQAPKEEGGLNIEGMTARVEGGVFIGFRNPVPGGRALLFTLLNPEQVIEGQRAELGDPLRLDLGGLGVRSLSSWRGRYLIAAGHYSDGARSRLYAWDGKADLKAIDVHFPNFNPEGFFTPESRDAILVLSDDGTVLVGDTECKKLKDPNLKRFRGAWITP
ncbi:MAG: DUF3616 domain-containing protein [Myxococcota bacterium]|jgi:Protein of unknown function (DUF3616)|nr:DUF3616 domain-containing protein [Myxococcota bacterium]